MTEDLLRTQKALRTQKGLECNKLLGKQNELLDKVEQMTSEKTYLKKCISDADSKHREVEYKFNKILVLFENQLKENEETLAKRKHQEQIRKTQDVQKLEQASIQVETILSEKNDLGLKLA